MIPSEREAAQDGGCSQCFGRHLCAYHEGYQDALDAVSGTVEYAVQDRDGLIGVPTRDRDDALLWAMCADQQSAEGFPHRVVQRLVGPWTAVPEDTE